MHAGCIENIRSQCECVQYTYNVILIAYEAHSEVPGQNFIQIACALGRLLVVTYYTLLI